MRFLTWKFHSEGNPPAARSKQHVPLAVKPVARLRARISFTPVAIAEQAGGYNRAFLIEKTNLQKRLATQNLWLRIHKLRLRKTGIRH
jgi:hypothetical protein